MNKFATSLRIITVFFTLITALILAAWVLELVSDESLRDAILKIAAISGIAAAVSAIIQLVTQKT